MDIFDEEFKMATKELFKEFENDTLVFITSDLLALELLNAPSKELGYPIIEIRSPKELINYG